MSYLPVVATGGISLAVGLRDGSWDTAETKALIGTSVLALFAAMANGTKLEPVVTALAWLVLASVLVRAFGTNSPSTKTTKKSTKNSTPAQGNFQSAN